MMTLQEVLQTINDEKLKRDFRNEMTPANSQLLRKRGENTFEAVLSGRGNEKCLIPEVGTLHFLYRGQNQEVIPCVPSLYRGNLSEVEIFVERMRLVVFKRLLATHPVIENFFRRHSFKVDEEGLAQHYGLKTSVLDLTSSIDVAIFFAICWYDKSSDSYHYYNDGKEHDAILYVFNPILDNEPTLSLKLENYMNHNITPIGLQAFSRPGAQQGYALHINKGNSTKSWMYRFKFTCEDSKRYWEMFREKETIWDKEDKLIPKAKHIATQSVFSFDVFDETFRDYRPKGFSKTKLKSALPPDIRLERKVSDIIFSKEEVTEITADWNNHAGEKTASKIRRKPWFEFDEIIQKDGEQQQTVSGIRNRNDYRTLKRLSMVQMAQFAAEPHALYGAEWVNYTNMPKPKEFSSRNYEGGTMIPASMENIFGKKYLAEDDWRI